MKINLFSHKSNCLPKLQHNFLEKIFIFYFFIFIFYFFLLAISFYQKKKGRIERLTMKKKRICF